MNKQTHKIAQVAPGSIAEELELAPVLQRELYQGLEVCYREMGQYQQAYEYASKQLAMQK